MNSTIQSINYQPYLNSLDKLGFCTFPLFDAGEIEQLAVLYRDNFGGEQVKKLYATHNSNPVEKSLYVNREIKRIVNGKLQHIFSGYDYFIGHFMVKAAHENKEFPLHQDWNIVDEAKYKSYQFWIPLQLTYPANGGMFVVPGSHQFFNNYRSGSYDIPRLPYDEKFNSIVTSLTVPAGDVLVYHNALFHASYPNTTDDNRMVVIVNYVERNAPTYYFHKDNAKGVTERYHINTEILIRHLPSLEKGVINDDFPFTDNVALCSVENETISADDLVSHYNKNIGHTDAGQIKQLHIAKSDILENELNKRGYAIIDLLNDREIEFLNKEYKARFGNIASEPGRFTTLQSTTNALKNEVHQLIVNTVSPSLDRFFKDYRIPVSQFYTKRPKTSGDIELHADSTLLLNHQLEPHYAIWIPLLDVGANNGTLTVIPGSHKVKGAVFGGSFSGYHYQHRAWLNQFEVPLHLKAGQAVVFDNNLLHNSMANKTDVDRVCVTFRLTHVASQYYSFYRANNDLNFYEVYKESHNYYMNEDWDGDEKKPPRNATACVVNNLANVKPEDLEKILRAY